MALAYLPCHKLAILMALTYLPCHKLAGFMGRAAEGSKSKMVTVINCQASLLSTRLGVCGDVLQAEDRPRQCAEMMGKAGRVLIRIKL